MSRIHFKYESSLEDFRASIMVTKNGNYLFNVGDGEPEDSNLGRNFSDCYKLKDIIEQANKDGLSGIKYEITEETVEE